ncbi:hypothetical protein GCM10007315_35380 [Gemmobacter tilapiae]|jgi:hypothetical protein|uniref:Uncharacterized protein n=1 Tax=Neogemmobacter tilapiae TaxID=875041 RepID=A0A918TYM7_9RHOB|nr:hypothetical protein GCM10007315_35380 [Gemmobacter tilapiae]
MEYKLTITYKNLTDSPVRIVNEPSAEQYLIGPNESADLTLLCSDPLQRVEIEQTPKCLYFHSNSVGTATYVMRDGVELPQAEQEY